MGKIVEMKKKKNKTKIELGVEKLHENGAMGRRDRNPKSSPHHGACTTIIYQFFPLLPNNNGEIKKKKKRERNEKKFQRKN